MSTDLRHRLGAAGEQLAAEHLERLGFRILARNHRTRWGELDLVAYDGTTLVFCEVKTRRAGRRERRGTPSARPSSVRSGAWPRRGWPRRTTARTPELRFDAIGVTVDARGRLAALEHLEGAF